MMRGMDGWREGAGLVKEGLVDGWDRGKGGYVGTLALFVPLSLLL